ncbi:MAG TPA: ribonuclease P protein component [Candidatus Magasanikbacteria bacterium]|uniref:Ribonuclease P protein component n=2 Tax=Candidatus Magasanikiibacteriota TaxID=1752731 RepID=A0A0G0YUN8_9BACT|nr:MAG: Ribonuclease P protein component [Candidatus Magasanikbacteria bacterium GW2011_GWC2_41_17]KKS13391.1 MAG: Ribonuclease P protein component [Candidatus Magasanikbacteria bacterium GW2011_GWA2_41_55]HBV58118.1 ribonuclease P protein component [Candidatus Magasanikbacteria bacterium]HBX16345.1 ribonuclease P protein component [Candidatus Magasanikbacteria bacterium]
MLLSINRLSEDRDFKRIFKFGQSFYSRNLQLKLAKKAVGQSKFGFVIGLVVSKKATIRNRLKRQVREAVRILYKNGLVKPNFDVVIKIKSSLIGADYKDIKAEVEYLLKKAGILM